MKIENETGWFIEWSFTPKNYFERPIRVNDDLYELTIDGGRAVAKIAEHAGDPRSSLKDQIHKKLNTRFAGAQLVSHQPYELSKPALHHQNLNGTTVYHETLELTMSMSAELDYTITDKDGNIRVDSKSERINEKRLFAALAAKFCESDPVARGLLSSHNAAVNDPQNELVRLYEVCDSLSKKFGGKKLAIAALNIPKDEWQELGRLANNAPLNQGRHRGKMGSELRDATKAELEMARKCAGNMIINYLRYLEANENINH